jgi:hypothetical protein
MGLCHTKKSLHTQYRNHMYTAMKVEYHSAWHLSMLVFDTLTLRSCAVWFLRFLGNAFTALFTST